MQHRKAKTGLGMSALLVLMLVAVGGLAQESPDKRPEGVSVTSYEIVVLELPKPLVKVYADGQRRSYTEVYVVRVKGNFLTHLSDAPFIFVGDHLISEYGGTEDGIYFKIYGDSLLDYLDGNSFGYGYDGQLQDTVSVRFMPDTLRPFRRVKDLSELTKPNGEK